MTLAGVQPAEARRGARDLRDHLQIGERAAAMPAWLSGGAAPRAAIARALANRPTITLADEPTAARDSERAPMVMDLLRQVAQDQQPAILVVTLDEKIVDRFARMVALHDGRIEQDWRRAA
jgi:putative ABC transport system ATP-binding protein